MKYILHLPKKWFQSGIFLSLLSALFFALYSFWYQFFRDDVSRSTTLVIRGTLQLAFLLPVSCIRGRKLLPDISQAKTTGQRAKIWIFLAIVILSGGLRLLAYYSALDLIDSSTVVTIANAEPLINLLIGHCIFPDDKITVKKVTCALVLLAGVALNSQIDKWSFSGVRWERNMTCKSSDTQNNMYFRIQQLWLALGQLSG